MNTMRNLYFSWANKA